MLVFIQSVRSTTWPPLTASPMYWLSRMTMSAPPLAAKSVKIWSCHWAMGTQRTSTSAPGNFLDRSVRAWQGCQANQITWSLPPFGAPVVTVVFVAAAGAGAVVSVAAAGAGAVVLVAAAGAGAVVSVAAGAGAVVGG